MKIITAANYYKTVGARDLCHGLKEGDCAAIAIVVKRMARYLTMLPPNSVLIPIPSHTGQATATLSLSEQLAKLSGLPVANIIKGRNREPLYTIKQNAQSILPEFFGFFTTATLTEKVPVLIDSVYDTGQTAHGAAKLFKNTSPFIFTFARVKKIRQGQEN